MTCNLEDLQTEVQRCSQRCQALRGELAKAVVGRGELIDQILTALLAGGHALIEGVAGLAKTLVLRSLAEATGLDFRRIPCTPDLQPGDLTRADRPEIDDRAGQDATAPPDGPLGANLILVDEIDLAPPKTRAVLMDAIHQRHILVRGAPRRLPVPCFVLATQNPVDREGTDRLRQSTLDRFLIHVRLRYPPGEDEWEIARRMTGGPPARITSLFSGEQIVGFQDVVARLPVPDPVLEFAWTLVRASRPHTPEAPQFVDRWLAWGAGPRGVIALLACAKARAALGGRSEAGIADVRAVAPMALRHRLAANAVARADAMAVDSLVELLLETISPPEG